jgi:tetratricopeptide (TPR) repeat protein
MTYGRLGQPAKAEAACRKALEVVERFPLPDVPRYRNNLANLYHNLAWHYQSAGKRDRAEPLYGKALALRKRLAKENPLVTEHQRTLGQVHHERGMLYDALDRLKESREAYREAIAVRQKLVRRPPANPAFLQDLAWSYHNLGNTYAKEGRPGQAEKLRARALAIREQLARDHPRALGYTIGLAAGYLDQGDRLARAARPGEALAWYGRAVGLLEGVLRQEPEHAEARRFLGNAHWVRAKAYRALERYDDAVKDWDRAIELDPGPRRPELRVYRAMTLAVRGDHARAAYEARDLAGEKALPGEKLYQLASVCGLSAGVVRRDAKLSPAEREKRAEEYARLALGLLDKARAAGFFRARAARRRLRTNHDLDPLRSRADFREWLAEVEKGEKK